MEPTASSEFFLRSEDLLESIRNLLCPGTQAYPDAWPSVLTARGLALANDGLSLNCSRAEVLSRESCCTLTVRAALALAPGGHCTLRMWKVSDQKKIAHAHKDGEHGAPLACRFMCTASVLQVQMFNKKPNTIISSHWSIGQ